MSAPASSRRALLAGAVTLPAAAMPALAGADPDAAVKALASQCIAAQRAYIAAFVGCSTLKEEHEREPLQDVLGRRAHDLMGDLANLPAVTLTGIAAKAAAMLEEIGPAERLGSLTTNGEALTRSVLEELAALAAKGGAA